MYAHQICLFREPFPAWKHKTYNVVSRKITLSALDLICPAVSTDCKSFSPLLFPLPHRSECRHCTLQRRRRAHGQAVMVPVPRGMQPNCAASLATRRKAVPRKGEAFSPICTSARLSPRNVWHQTPPSWRPSQRTEQRVEQGCQPQERMIGLNSETLPAGEEMAGWGQRVLKPLDYSYAQGSDLHVPYQCEHRQCEGSEVSYSSRTWSY